MPKTFYTEKDIEDMVKSGIRSLTITEDVVLTDLAYEKARKLELQLVRENDQPPAAPVRPYIAKPPRPAAPPAGPAAPPADLKERVRQAVLARLGTQVDAQLLDTIITRVLSQVGPK